MLELHILKFLMKLEGQSSQQQGRVTGYSVSWLQKSHDVPKSTFYRALNQLVDCGIIVKQKRNQYTVSNSFRQTCNSMGDGQNLSS